MPRYLHALALQHYRGIGGDMQFMGPFSTFNLFIGANNSGKSTVLNFISKYIPLTANGPAPDELERHSGGGNKPIRLRIGVPTAVAFETVLDKMQIGGDQQKTLKQLCSNLSTNGFIWFSATIPLQSGLQLFAPLDPPQLRGLFPQQEWSILWSSLNRKTGGSLDQHWIPETLKAIADIQDFSMRSTKLIPAIREIGPKSREFKDYSGAGLIDRLAEIQSPDHNKRHERAIFDKINSFLQTVTDHPEAEIEVPHNREHILVHMDGKILPLASLGTGIQEVIMLAAFCTISEEQIVCIEEPEIHLHPLLQRKLLNYLRTKTNNQYFIATHSPSFIDTPDAAIFHVSLENKQTVIRESILRSQRFAICVDLGHRASELLQANAVIWVEGPSDRIYLKHWIGAVAPDLIEGIHYSLMFYGGRLLSHLTAEDDEITEFINLKALNQHSAIVIDSDKANKNAKLNGTKKRIVDEFGRAGGVAWVTKGREIENYISHESLQQIVKSLYANIYKSPSKGGTYDHALLFKRLTPKKNKKVDRYLETDVDKVKVAREICKLPPDLNVQDLRKRVQELVDVIRRANS